MLQKLGLSDAEATKVKTINQKYAEKMEPVLKSSDSSLSKMRQAKAIQSAKDDELRGVLRPEKFAAYSETKDEMKQAMQQQLKH